MSALLFKFRVKKDIALQLKNSNKSVKFKIIEYAGSNFEDMGLLHAYK